MTNTVELEVAITRSDLSKKQIAEKLGISTMALYNKINNISEFKPSEISVLLEILPIEDKDYIFFVTR